MGLPCWRRESPDSSNMTLKIEKFSDADCRRRHQRLTAGLIDEETGTAISAR